ncbi:LCP family protein [Gordonia sp. ABSL1-1]|uniref:LCP family protein n=1 Tax=Gordonia sp. ABSL1-1 TaxID=3053923 RepID=UPI002573E274|nr:LCP family protein [Gordonia sp. ABSL1-1]MDL9937083.1 LCP family protein [Gordonia sp. ABSL1-1]
MSREDVYRGEPQRPRRPRPATDDRPRRRPTGETPAERRPRRIPADGGPPRRPRRAAVPDGPDLHHEHGDRSSGEIHTRSAKHAAGAPKSRRVRPASARTAETVRPDKPARPRRQTRPAESAAAADVIDTPPPTDRGTRRGAAHPDPRRFGGSHWGRGIIALVSAAVLVCTGYAWNTMTSLQNDITQASGLGLGGAKDGAVDILLVGTDSRTDAKGNPLSADELKMLRSGNEIATNTDTILLIRIPEDGSSATAISIPRDSYVDVPGIGKSKINAAYGATREGVRAREVEAGTSERKAEEDGTRAGRKALIDTVANLTGVHVDHYAEVGLLGFVLLTKAVGGVDVCLKAPARDPFTGARFRGGRQTLNGPRALSFVRQRHGLPRGDLDRITRQQAFMASLTQKILSAGTLTSPSKLDDLQNAVSRTVVIDDNWDVLSFAQQFKDLSGGKVKFATIPVVTDQGWSEDGQQSVVQVDPRAVAKFTADLLDNKSAKNQRAEYTVDVSNAGTIDGLAGNVANILTNKGFKQGQINSEPADTRDSLVIAHDENDGARALARDLGGARIVVDDKLDEHQLKAVLTNTYTGPGSISDTGSQADNRPASERVGNNRPPITAGGDGPACVN